MRESRFWALFMASAILIIVLLGVHMFLLHLESILAFLGIEVGEVLDYSSVMDRGSSPFWLVFYLIFLTLGLYHGFYGLRSVLLEVITSEGGGRAMTGVVVIIGVTALIYGIYILAQSFSMGGI